MKIKELLDNSPERWTRDFYAKDNNGNLCSSRCPWASKWCLEGCLDICYSNEILHYKIMGKIYDYIIKLIENGLYKRNTNKVLIVDFNDNPKTTFEDIKKLVNELDI